MNPANCTMQFITEIDSPLCNGLLILKEEHIYLNKQLEAIYAFTQCIENEEVSPNYHTLQDLFVQIQDFVAVLEPHSDFEENVLFDMVAAYIGRTHSHIAVMENEHEKAQNLLRRFLFGARQCPTSMGPKEIIEITSLASKAYHILTDQFIKEETILFPLANQLLSSLEKAILEERVISRKK